MLKIDLKEKTAFVSGGSRGIGAAIVKTLAVCGAKVGFCYKNNDDAAQKVINEVKNSFVKSYKFSIDNADEVKINIKNVIKDLGKIDILVNNAGITKDTFFAMMGKETWNSVINTTLHGTYNVTKQVITKMISKKQGVIINMSSIAGIIGTSGQVNYSTAKAGIIGFTKSLAKEYAKYNIRVICVAPGFIKTDMFYKIPQDIRTELIKSISLNRVGEPIDVANLVAFLASDLARYITGQVICIDGGLV